VRVSGTQMHSSLSDRMPSVNANLEVAKLILRLREEFPLVAQAHSLGDLKPTPRRHRSGRPLRGGDSERQDRGAFDDFADPAVNGLVDQAPTIDQPDGCFALPEQPGLGLRLNHDACGAMPRTRAHFDLFQPGWEQRRPAAVQHEEPS